jgi:hypothetical protein
LIEVGIIKSLPTESTDNSIPSIFMKRRSTLPELRQHENDVLEEIVQNQKRILAVAFTTMPE